jgi:uncharacterized membrane protein SirB2
MKYYKEIWLIEAIIFSIFWVSDEYLATLLTFVAVPVFLGILVVSLVAERIESSKISKDYFYMVGGLALIPALIFMAIYFVNGGTSFDWAKQ